MRQLLLGAVLRDPQLANLELIREVADAPDVVVVRMRDNQVVQQRTTTRTGLQEVTEDLEHIDGPLAVAAANVDEHVLVVGQGHERAVALATSRNIALKSVMRGARRDGGEDG